LMMAGIPNGMDIAFPKEGENQAFFDEGERAPYHVLDMHWDGQRPMLTYRRLEGGLYSGGIGRVDLSSLSSIDLRAGRGVYCVGRIEEEHLNCRGAPVAAGYAQCWSCLTMDIPDPSCIFEPHCHKGSCGAFFCQVPHVVYLAMYGSRMKVGMTQDGRVMERGTEQGADLMQVLARTKDRYSARSLETIISTKFRISEAMHPQTVLKGMAVRGTLEESRDIAWRFLSRLREMEITLKDLLGSRRIEVLTLPREVEDEPLVPEYPIPDRLASVPREIPVDIVRGEVVGYKGKWGVIRSNGSLAAFRLNDLVGRIVRFADNH